MIVLAKALWSGSSPQTPVLSVSRSVLCLRVEKGRTEQKWSRIQSAPSTASTVTERAIVLRRKMLHHAPSRPNCCSS